MGIAPGALALVGSGEYTAAMRTTDEILLGTLQPDDGVVVIPTASALEPGQPERWNSLGVAHFHELGARVTPLLLLHRTDALSLEIAAVLEEQRFFYFSGGSPDHCIETFVETLAWETIRARHAEGAVIAGCSAGAMMLGAATLSVRALRQGDGPRWKPALGLVPGVAVLPHFDRMRGFMGDEVFQTVLATAPAGFRLLGIDEDTALIRIGDIWQVSGRQSVSVYGPDGLKVYQAGEVVPMGAEPQNR